MSTVANDGALGSERVTGAEATGRNHCTDREAAVGGPIEHLDGVTGGIVGGLEDLTNRMPTTCRFDRRGSQRAGHQSESGSTKNARYTRSEH
jgi:hypothetical protein